MIAPFPHQYAATVRRFPGGRGILEAGERLAIDGGAPPEFGGSDAVWSPEHLLLGAVGLCLETTFEALAARDHLVVDEWRVNVDGAVDRTTAGLAFTQINATIHITVQPDLVARTHAVAGRARRCLISSSLRVPVDVAIVVVASDSGRCDPDVRSVDTTAA
jgi:organic hydroperoxide reductase OsmC/OhrA